MREIPTVAAGMRRFAARVAAPRPDTSPPRTGFRSLSDCHCRDATDADGSPPRVLGAQDTGVSIFLYIFPEITAEIAARRRSQPTVRRPVSPPRIRTAAV